MKPDLASMLLATAEKRPGAVAQIHHGVGRSYAVLADRALSVAAHLQTLGLGPGDPVALMLPNGPAFTEAYFAILCAGGVVVPLSAMFTGAEAGPLAARSGARVLITGDGASPEAIAGVRLSGAGTVLYAGAGLPDGAEDFSAIAGQGRRPGRRPAIPSDATAVLFFTSGTTGTPKGAELTHANLLSNARWVAESSLAAAPGEVVPWGPGHVSLARLPLSHSFGQTTMQNAPFVHGGAVAYAEGPFSPDATLAQMARDRVTVAAMVPAMAAALADCPAAGDHDLSLFRFALVGGAPIPAHLFARFERRLGAIIVEGYGLSETSPVCAFRTPATPRRAGSVGRAAAGAEIAVADDSGHRLPPGKTGEIVVRGAPVMKGYFRDPGATARAIRDGWLFTGDVGRVDAGGYVFVVDRKADTVIRNGYNVYPAEVESALRGHPHVAEAAVVGVPDGRVGEEVVAFIVPADGCRPDAEALQAYCRTRLARYKHPRRFLVVGDLPRGSKGQVLRSALRARLAADAPVGFPRPAP